MDRKLAMELISKELDRAEKKLPKWHEDKIHAAAVVQEEAGELCKAALQAQYENGSDFAMLTEATHTAAVALRFIMSFPTTVVGIDKNIVRSVLEAGQNCHIWWTHGGELYDSIFNSCHSNDMLFDEDNECIITCAERAHTIEPDSLKKGDRYTLMLKDITKNEKWDTWYPQSLSHPEYVVVAKLPREKTRVDKLKDALKEGWTHLDEDDNLVRKATVSSSIIEFRPLDDPDAEVEHEPDDCIMDTDKPIQKIIDELEKAY
jgi:hypothetical protein